VLRDQLPTLVSISNALILLPFFISASALEGVQILIAQIGKK
jgi:hypothetical protein